MEKTPKSKIIILIIFLLVIAVATFFLWKGIAKINRIMAEKEEISSYNELSEEAFGSTEPHETIPLPGQSVEVEKIPRKKPDPRPSMLDFASLQEEYPDMVGWIKCKDTLIDYPIMQGEDNDFYLHHLYNGKEGANGSIFMDWLNHPDFYDCNSILYGHNMASGQMFHSINGYKFQSYYDTFPTMQLFTPYGDYTVSLIAGFIYSKEADINVEFLDCADDERVVEYIDWAKSVSTFKSPETVQADDRLVTLVTCTYEYENARYVLHGKLIPTDFNNPA